MNEINLPSLQFLNGISVKVVDKFRVVVFAIQLIMLPKVFHHFGWADSNDNDSYDSSELSASIVKNVTQEMFERHYLLQEVITTNYSGHFT